jgi:predicted nucleic acid-binding Zn ribbon protein
LNHLIFEYNNMFNDLKSLLPKSIQRSGIYKRVEASQIIDQFNKFKDEILPGHISSKAQAMYVKNKVLYIASLSSLVTQELKFKESDIIKLLNEYFGREVINKLRFIS